MIKMKKYIITLVILSICTICFAQTADHLAFKGVPIDGTINEYVAKMKQNGFTHVQTENGTAILTGDFAGYKGCYIGVTTLKQKDLVFSIAVLFPDKETWSNLHGNYIDLKTMLTEKYGEPTYVVEKFDGASQPDDDQDKMYQVKFDNCKYYSIWETAKGDIQLSIKHNSVTSCYVKLGYFDKINSDKIKDKAKDDL
jgi:hypothetical protein